ncbi:hypothetical protein VE04_00269 [Pseudogymnoascus sp. 24MN13]|nr:hypothetical protein VE04_00269 [Pseudogymnoascus sp. 24MN13]
MGILPRSNMALHTNPNIFHYPTSADITNNSHGSDWLWAVTAFFAFFTCCIIGDSYRGPRRARAFHYLAAAVSVVTTINYFTMASNLGYVAIFVEFVRDKAHVRGDTREIYYVRYIDWFLTGTLLVLATLLTARTPLPIMLWTVFLTWMSVLTLLTGALVASSYKWGYFVISILSLFGVVYNLLWTARRYAARHTSAISRTYLSLAAWLSFMSLIYPISQIDPAVLGMAMRDYGEDEIVEKIHRAGEVAPAEATEGGVVETA